MLLPTGLIDFSTSFRKKEWYLDSMTGDDRFLDELIGSSKYLAKTSLLKKKHNFE